MTLRVVDVALEHLSVNTFELFGEIIGTHDSPPVFSGPHIKSWSLNFTCDGDTEFMYVRYIHQPLEFSVLESHSGVTQCFTPLGYYPSVMVVAPANAGDDNPRLSRAEFGAGISGSWGSRHLVMARHLARFDTLPGHVDRGRVCTPDLRQHAAGTRTRKTGRDAAETHPRGGLRRRKWPDV